MRSERASLSRFVRETVWNMTRGHCWYCGFLLNPFRDFVVEHVVPLCRGGTDAVENLVPACAMCNQGKGTRVVEEWRPFFAEENGLGPDPGEWRFWYERESQAPGYPQEWMHKKYEREEWRRINIVGYYAELDCRAVGGC